jgi:hypothetical protein
VSALFASGHIVDVILVLVALEGVGLIVWHRRTGRGIATGDVLSLLASGVFLMVALRCALVGAWWGTTAAALAGGGGAHLVDLARRWRMQGKKPSENRPPPLV